MFLARLSYCKLKYSRLIVAYNNTYCHTRSIAQFLLISRMSGYFGGLTVYVFLTPRLRGYLCGVLVAIADLQVQTCLFLNVVILVFLCQMPPKRTRRPPVERNVNVPILRPARAKKKVVCVMFDRGEIPPGLTFETAIIISEQARSQDQNGLRK